MNEDEIDRRRKSNMRVTAIILTSFVVLVFFIAFVRMGGGH